MIIINKIHKNISQIIRQNYLNESTHRLQEIYNEVTPIFDEIDRIKALLSRVKLETPDEKVIQKIAAHKNNIQELVKEKWRKPAGWDFSDHYPEYITRLRKYIEKLPENEIFEQSADRFYRQENDSWFLNVRKKLKLVLFKTGRIPFQLLNFFRIILKKPAIPIPFWSHTVPVQSLVEKVYSVDLIRDLIRVENSKYEQLAAALLSLKIAENQADLSLHISEDTLEVHPGDSNGLYGTEQVKKLIEENVRRYLKETETIIRRKRIELGNKMERAGTIEYPARQLYKIRLNRRFIQNNRLWLENEENWSRTLFALFDDWRLDLEINQLKFTAFLELFDKKKRLNDKKFQILSGLEQINGFFDKLTGSFNVESGLNRKQLISSRLEIQRKINSGILTSLLDQLDSKILIGLVRQIEIRLENEINKLSEVRALVKTDLYSRALRENEINYISPSELILFEVFPKLIKLTTQLKNSVFNQLAEITRLIPDIDNIVIFSIETVLSSSEDDTIDVENTQVMMKGITRARNRIEEINNMVQELFKLYEDKLGESIQAYTAEAISLTRNENALDIRLKLLKAKAINQTESYKRRLFSAIKNLGTNSLTSLKSGLNSAVTIVDNVRRRYFLQPSDVIITQEISEFLSESKNSINQLPVIYRRLYSIEPITDMDLFIGRDAEFNRVKESYQNWHKGRTSSSAIIGEKWGGLSSFINFIPGRIKFSYPVHKISIKEKIYEVEHLVNFLSKTLVKGNITTTIELIEQIQQYESRKIVILEDVQHLYLRAVNGFEAIKSLMNIISQTHDKIYWIVTCTQYAWSYLCKTLNVDDHFHFVTFLESMDEEHITSVIKKRNQIGGFQIVFQTPVELANTKKFRLLSEDEQQEILRKRFFRKLNEFARSNISMALIFWLLSTRKVTDEKIIVGDFNNPDQSFLKIMTQVRIYILLALILHDGLSISEISRVNHQEVDDMRLQISSLFEDGIIIRQNGLNMVNPLIYRNVISVLRLKNLIH